MRNKTFTDTKQTSRRQMRGQDRPMPCGVWAAVPSVRDNTGSASGEARRRADHKVLGEPSAALLYIMFPIS
jgi:hypothetical protein